MLNNAEILKDLKRADDNATAFSMLMKHWNTEESEFPYKEVRDYIKLETWKPTDFNLANELTLSEKLDPFMIDVFFIMKDFRAHSKTELTSKQEAYALLEGIKYETQDDKAAIVYKAAVSEHYKNSKLNKGE